MLAYTGERVVPWKHVGREILGCHVARYAWATRWTYGKRVVDLGCGTGYGTFLLSWGAKEVAGVDLSLEAVRYAAAHFSAANIRWEVNDLERPGPDGLPIGDVYVAFEVLEHLNHPERVVERYRPIVWSIPIGDGSRYHKRAYTVGEAVALAQPAEVWLQSGRGEIVPAGKEWFHVAYVLGVSQ